MAPRGMPNLQFHITLSYQQAARLKDVLYEYTMPDQKLVSLWAINSEQVELSCSDVDRIWDKWLDDDIAHMVGAQIDG